MFRKVLVPIAILLFAVLMVLVLLQTRTETGASPRPAQRWLVDAMEVTLSTQAPEITLYGRVETPVQTVLKAALEADVDTVDVLEGNLVDAGQLLVKLDATDAELHRQQRQADVEEIRALIDNEQQRHNRDLRLIEHQRRLVELADKAVERAQTLELSRLASQSALDEARAAREQQMLALKQLEHDIAEHPSRLAQLRAGQSRSRAQLAQAEVDLARTEVRAPFAGRISMRRVSPGDRVRPGDSLVGLYDLNRLEVRAQIPGRHIDQIRQLLHDNRDILASAKVQGRTLRLKLERLSGEVRPDSGGLDGLFTLQDSSAPLPLGTFVELQMKLAPQPGVIVVPFTALYGLDRIYRIEDGLLQAVQVERVGELRTADGRRHLLIRSTQLHSGDRIAITQLPNAMTGLRVEVSGD